MKVAVVTIARGRRRHLERQARAVSELRPAPARYVVVALDLEPPKVPGATVVHRPVADGTPLPLSAARNRGIAHAGSVDLVVCLDVDCLPEPALLEVLAGADHHGRILAGPVGRLGPLPASTDKPSAAELRRSRIAAQAGARPVPMDGAVADEPRYELFWSLSFAVSPATHTRIGGFDEAYVGYGAEDTDYAFRARDAGVGLTWVGGAWAHHQHHEVSDPPVEHVADIVANARRFHRRWGRWPMEGWLTAFVELGLIEWESEGERLELICST